MRRSRDDFTFVVGIVALLAIAAFASQARSQQLEPMTPVRKLTPAEMNHMVGNNIPPGYMVSNGHLIPYGSGQPAVGGSSGTLGAVVPVTKTVMTSGWQSSFGSRSASSGSCGTPSVPQSRPTPLSRPSGSGVPFFSRFRGNPDFPVKKSASTGDCASGQCDANTPPRPSRPALDSGSGSKDSGSRVSGGGGSSEDISALKARIRDLESKLADLAKRGSVKGDKGDAGSKGERGERGERGPAGPPGPDNSADVKRNMVAIAQLQKTVLDLANAVNQQRAILSDPVALAERVDAKTLAKLLPP